MKGPPGFDLKESERKKRLLIRVYYFSEFRETAPTRSLTAARTASSLWIALS
jgi:hypothetical protein